MQKITYYRGRVLSRHEVCPHCFKSGLGRRKLNRFCPQCGEPVHRLCLKSTAPAHDGFLSHIETLRRQGISPGDVFVQLSDWPRKETDDDGQCPEPDEMGRQELNSISAWRDGTEQQRQAYIEAIYRPNAIRIAIDAAVASVQPSPFISEYRE